MKLGIRTLLLAASLPIAGIACAQSDIGSAASRAGGGMTLVQFVGRQSERIMAADTDGDGKLSTSEFAAQARAGKIDPSRLFDRMDTNHDGFLDKNEIRTALARRFERLDANHDGVVMPDERMAMRQRGSSAQDGDGAPHQGAPNR